MKPFNPLLFLSIILFSQSCKTEDSLSNVSYWDSTKTDWELGFLNGQVKRTVRENYDFDFVKEKGLEEFIKKDLTEYDYNKYGFIVKSYSENYNKLSTTVIKGENIYRDSLKRDLKERYNSFKDDYEGYSTKPYESEMKYYYYYNENEQLVRIEIEDLIEDNKTVKLVKYDNKKITEYEYDRKDDLLGYEIKKFNPQNLIKERKRFSSEGVVDFESYYDYDGDVIIKDSTIYHNEQGRNTYVFLMDNTMRIESFKTYTYIGGELNDFEVKINEYDTKSKNSSYVSKTYKDQNQELLYNEERVERELDDKGNIVLEVKKDMIRDRVLSKSVVDIIYYE